MKAKNTTEAPRNTLQFQFLRFVTGSELDN